MRSRSALLSCFTPTASARRSGASRAVSTPVMTCRNSPFIAGGCKASFIRRCAHGSANPRWHLGCRLASFTQDDGGVTAYFFDRGGSHRHTARGDILIGADGIHSMVRQRLFPDEGSPNWNGLMLWRGAVDWPAFLTGRSMVVAGGLARQARHLSDRGRLAAGQKADQLGRDRPGRRCHRRRCRTSRIGRGRAASRI